MVAIDKKCVQSYATCKLGKKHLVKAIPSTDYFDTDSFRLDPNYNIWVFDNLLSSYFLELVDQDCMERPGSPKQMDHNPHLTKYSVRIPRTSWTEEVFEVLFRIANVCTNETTRYFIVGDVTGPTNQALQAEHMDWGAVRNLGTELSSDRLHFDDKGENVIPTFSFILYFNDVGGLVFPNIGKAVNAKRGRIVMLQNYHKGADMKVDYRNRHYGTYTTEPKRLALFGILTEMIPVRNMPKPSGILYCANAHGGGYENDICYDREPAQIFATKLYNHGIKPGNVIWNLEKKDKEPIYCYVPYWIIEAKGSTLKRRGKFFHRGYTYKLKPYRNNIFTVHFQKLSDEIRYGRIVEGYQNFSVSQYPLDIDHEIAADEILEFIGLAHLGTRAGWICSITGAQREARRAEWRAIGCSCVPPQLKRCH